MAKTCKHCKLHAETPEDVDSLFASNGKKINGDRRYKNQCKNCTNAINSKRLTDRYNEDRSSYLLYKYNITETEYNKMFKEQEGCCSICNTHQTRFKKRLAVDHCHVTNKIRGLLCQKCNQAIGLLDDSVDNLKSAIMYLGGGLSLK